MAEDVGDLLGYFFHSLLFVILCVPQAIGVDPIWGVCACTSLAMAPEVAIGVSFLSFVRLDVFYGHLQN